MVRSTNKNSRCFLSPLPLWERVLSGVAAKRVRGIGASFGTFPLTRLDLTAFDLATLSHKRAFTPVFDGLWGEGKKSGDPNKNGRCFRTGRSEFSQIRKSLT
jgi:hypothetical protein